MTQWPALSAAGRAAGRGVRRGRGGTSRVRAGPPPPDPERQSGAAGVAPSPKPLPVLHISMRCDGLLLTVPAEMLSWTVSGTAFSGKVCRMRVSGTTLSGWAVSRRVSGALAQAADNTHCKTSKSARLARRPARRSGVAGRPTLDLAGAPSRGAATTHRNRCPGPKSGRSVERGWDGLPRRCHTAERIG